MKEWFAVHTQSRKEINARQNLLNQSFEVYLPCFKRLIRHARQKHWGIAPLFPRYLFVHTDLGASRWRAINSTIGVDHLICQNDRPVAIDEQVISDIQNCEDPKGHVQLHRLFPFSVGDSVQFVEGALQDHRGQISEISEQQRVAVLFNMLGREVEVLVGSDEIVRAAT